MEIASGRRFPSPLARGSIAGIPTTLVIDTGAQVSVVDAALARRANLDLAQSAEGRDPTGNQVEMRRTDRPRLALEGWGSLPDRAMAVVDPAASLEAPPPGASQSLPDAKLCRYDEGSFSVRVLVVPAMIDGVPTMLEVDTGASGTLVVANSDVGRRLASRGDAVRGGALGAAGPIETSRVDGLAMQVGSVATSGAVLVTQGERDDHCGYEGRLGIDHLKSCVLVIDQASLRGTCKPATARPPVAP